MNLDPAATLATLERDLWHAADQLRANSKLTSSEYCMPVLGVIFLRHAANRFEAAGRQIQDDQASGKMPKRTPRKEDFVKRRALWLPEQARYPALIGLPKHEDLGKHLVEAMTAIERDHPQLAGVLPKEFTIFERDLLEDLLRIFNSETLQKAGGDVFGRIYEYFLQEFAIQGAQDNGEFFTPPSLVQLIVNVIEPDHGTIFDPACGSGGMFVQSSHFIERHGKSTARSVTFFGQEKTATTIKLAKMNLAVHGLEGDIREANTFYEDVHTLAGKCDFVMANPPFNVDMVDAEKVKDDTRLPFGLPSVNKNKKVGNGNYLWISYFFSYLNARGRAGFVMSSQASSAGHGEKEVRHKLVETGAVDVMISIRNNFFYTRPVPCELWFLDRGKPAERRDKVLMLDARNVFRKVTRKLNDFAPEQLTNLSAIVWLYRGQGDRFLGLVKDYLASLCRECEAVPASLQPFETAMQALTERLTAFAATVERWRTNSRRTALQSRPSPEDGSGEPSYDGASGNSKDHDDELAHKQFTEALKELREARKLYGKDRGLLTKNLGDFWQEVGRSLPETNDIQHKARKKFDPLAERIKGLIKQVDLLARLAARTEDAAKELSKVKELAEEYDRRAAGREVKQLDAGRKEAVEQLKHAVYFHRQVAWLQDRFPEAKLCDVPGLVKVVNLKDIEASDWSLTPGRFVGVAPAEEDEEFDFEQTLQDIHTELAGLNEEAVELAARIQENFEELGL